MDFFSASHSDDSGADCRRPPAEASESHAIRPSGVRPAAAPDHAAGIARALPVILKRAGRLLARIRGSAPTAAATGAPARGWADELADAATTPSEWLARRQTEGRLYVDVSD